MDGVNTPRQIKESIALHSKALSEALSQAEAVAVFDPMSEGWSGLRWLWMQKVRRDPNLNPTAKLLAHSVALRFADGLESDCRPTHDALMADAGIGSVRTVVRALKDLVDQGWLVRLGGNAPGAAAGYQCVFANE